MRECAGMSLERDPNAIPPSDLHASDPSLTAQPLVYFEA